MAETGERIEIDYLDPGQQPGVAEIRVLPDTVEVHAAGRLAGIFDREELRAWLHQPVMPKPMESAGATLSVDLESRLVIYLPDVPTWVRAPDAERQLREALS